ncbi:MAG TPA: right-handed parallel beta-helix repeat-containing protein [Candidatus Limnocylindrales bacterium]|nr:right-handed parallel beta-helix repeat-containing protein [Candidatus Limnocylindrales bacterium]
MYAPVKDKIPANSRTKPGRRIFSMKNERSSMMLAAFFAMVGLIGGSASSAMAVGLITSCGSYGGSGDWKLNGAISSTNADACITMTNGKNLDTNGYTITCIRSAGCGPAVQCEDGSGVTSIVQGTVNDTVNDIVNGTGTFSAGVKNCGTVREMKIVNATTGILWANGGNNGKAYQRNVIQSPAGGTGIDMVLLDSSDVIENNRIDGGSIGIHIVGRSSATGPLIQKNMIRGYTYAGINNTDTTYFRLTDNVVIEGGEDSIPINAVYANATFTHNLCEDDGDIGGTAPCSCQLDRMIPPAAGSTLSCL